MQGHKERDIIDVLKDYAWYSVALLLFAAIASQYQAWFFLIWKFGRMAELYFWYFLTLPFDSSYFGEAILTLKATAPIDITWAWLFEFEAYYNHYLRFFYGFFFFVIGGKFFYNYLRVTEPLNVQSMIELYRHEAKAIEVLTYDNPLKHHLIFDFENRSDYHNRHAQGLQPNQYMTANPPPNASLSELETHRSNVKAGRSSPFKPIAILDRKQGVFSFNRDLAKRSFERQLTAPPVNAPFYLSEENVPRLFDDEGNLIPLVRNERGHIVGGFSTNKLLNNGREYKGSASDIALLFNGIEREVYFTLCSRYKHPTVALSKVVMELVKQHAFTRTFLASLLNLVREHEIIASSEFYLLCRKDRGLFFTLYSASEEKPYWEATGVMAHYHHELEVGHAISTPQVLTAVDALEKEYRRLQAFEPDFKSIFERLTYAMSNEALLHSDTQIDIANVEGDYALVQNNQASSGNSLSNEQASEERVRNE
ncbi:hypothetical protein L1D14_25530 [Vibrio tubiashii]|uniref:secretion/conjugation apparatus DotM-related subunit n=1 Tax=Vibrio tubiashii TaxID=29498 RepID=UPI001EFE4C6B|nr:hypothetical protein [Vibrio tubiashii]MCG9579573.1 hypothetical protein [Vibrio tubiashii]